jgi:two-component system, LytTR family, sensor kinase
MHLFTKPRFLLSFAVFMLAIMAMHIWLLYTQGLPLQIVIVEPIISAAVITILCYLQSNMLGYYTPQQSRQLFIIAWALAFTLAWLAITYGGMYIYFKNNINYISFYKNTIVLRIFFGWQFISAVGFYNTLWQAQQHELNTQSREDEINRIANNAELHKLRQQIQPHFLFNSLNSINALIGQQPKEARGMIEKLSEFLRATLKKEERELITLQDELKYVQLYLDIEKVRFGTRLQAIINVQPEANALLLPNLILQPILENAIKYGLYNTVENVLININALVDNNYLVLAISNPTGDDTSANKGTGFGLKSIEKRLQIIYNQNNLLSTSLHHNIFTTTIKIPI